MEVRAGVAGCVPVPGRKLIEDEERVLVRADAERALDVDPEAVGEEREELLEVDRASPSPAAARWNRPATIPVEIARTSRGSATRRWKCATSSGRSVDGTTRIETSWSIADPPAVRKNRRQASSAVSSVGTTKIARRWEGRALRTPVTHRSIPASTAAGSPGGTYTGNVRRGTPASWTQNDGSTAGSRRGFETRE